MAWSESFYSWLVYSALLSLVVLAVGSSAALLCRQPVRRLRIIELSLAACLLAPLLGMVPGYPQLGIAWLVPQSHISTTQPHRSPVILSEAEDLGQTDHTAISGEIHQQPAFQVGAPQDGIMQDDMAAAPPAPTAELADMPECGWNIGLWLVGLYLLGVAVGVAWWLLGLVALGRIVWTAKAAPPRCRELLTEIAGQRSAQVRLLTSRLAKQPFASVGMTVQLPPQRSARHRAVIVLPESLCDDEQAVRWALAHEWSHIEHSDFLAWFLAGLVRVLFFYQPLVWWLRRQLRLCQDYVADGRASRQAAQPEDYAEFLTARASAGTLHPAMVGLGMGFRRSELYRRVVMLVENQPLENRPPRLWTALVSAAALIAIGVLPAFSLKPEAAAQEDTAAAQQAPAELKKVEVDVDQTKAGIAGPFVASLPDGVTVELLGVSTHPSDEKSWWRPDGSSLAKSPCDTLKGSIDGGDGHVVREFALQLHGMPEGTLGTKVEFMPRYDAYAGSQPTRNGKKVPGLKAMTVSLPDRATVTVRVGVGSGPWHTVFETERGRIAIGQKTGGFAFSPIIEKDDSVTITVAHNIIGPQSRIIAVGMDGREHDHPSHTSSGGAAGFRQITATFSNLSQKDVKVFRVQTRPYKWLAFHNVSLRAGQKTNVHVLHERELPDGKTMVTGIWQHPDPAKAGPQISNQEMDKAIKEKKYKFLKTYDSPSSGKQYVYRLTFSDGRNVGMNFSLRLEDITSLEDYAQKQAKQQQQKRNRINQAVAAGRIRLLNVYVMESHICQDVNSGIKFKVQRIRHPDGKEVAFPRGDYGQMPDAMKETSWQEHLQAIREGKRRLLGIENVNSYTYEMTADDGTKEIFQYGGGKPLLQKIKDFSTEDKLIAKDGITIDKGTWRIDAAGTRTVRLFEIPDPDLEDCRVIYRAKLKCENLKGRAYLEMWCRMPSGGEYFSKGLINTVQGTNDWATFETPFRLKKGERPNLIKLNLVVEGKAGMIAEDKGTVWIKDVELLKGPLLEK